jgi:hypothetical protein
VTGRDGLDWDRGPWCSRCGHPSALTGPGLVPAYPLGVCGRGTVERPGCGHIVLVTVKAEAERIFDARRRRLTTSRHKLHQPEHYPVTYCTLCETYTPAILPADPGIDAGATLAPAAASEGGP